GVDPKSILCEFFKVGKCAKGFKCKFSHDLNVQRKGEKIDIYSDKRDQETIEDCDQETLEKVVESKAKEYQQNKPTDIRAKLKTSTPMTPELFMEWKKKKIAERDESLAAQRAERAKNDSMRHDFHLLLECFAHVSYFFQSNFLNLLFFVLGGSGRELFMSDASLFVDDAKAYEKYQREEEYDVPENKANNNSATDGPSTSATSAAVAESLTDDDDE
ncbi:hypothetical protein Gohar_025254, partial [Gossypium harknessii]|nr:hypothetical protein [Gossypium harknessii]